MYVLLVYFPLRRGLGCVVGRRRNTEAMGIGAMDVLLNAWFLGLPSVVLLWSTTAEELPERRDAPFGVL